MRSLCILSSRLFLLFLCCSAGVFPLSPTSSHPFLFSPLPQIIAMLGHFFGFYVSFLPIPFIHSYWKEVKYYLRDVRTFLKSEDYVQYLIKKWKVTYNCDSTQSLWIVFEWSLNMLLIFRTKPSLELSNYYFKYKETQSQESWLGESHTVN